MSQERRKFIAAVKVIAMVPSDVFSITRQHESK